MQGSLIDLDEGVVEFTDTGDGSVSTETADIVVGADGAGSVIRKAMEKTEDFQATQEFLDHGYKELSIPPVAEGPHAPFAMDPKALHIWPHGASMMIALPNQDGSFTCTLFWPRTGEHSFASPTTGEVVAFFEEWYPDAVPVMPELETEYRENPVSPLGTVRCAPWHQGRFVLIGDAAHAIVPFYGQGANASFEDAVALAREIEEGGRDVPAALERYYRDRVEHANAIADMALANFIEMRDHTASRGFRLRKKLERILHRVLGRRFVPLYEMVSFTLIPYADARRRARRQWRLAISGGLGLMLLIVVGAIIILT